MVLAGGILSVIAPASLRSTRFYRLLLFCSIGYSAVLAARNLELRDLLTVTGRSPLAPGTALASCLVFVSITRKYWSPLVRSIAFGTLAVSLITLFELIRMRSATRREADWRVYTYSAILEITAIVAFAWFSRTRRPWLGYVPVAVLIATSIAMQTRLMVVELVSLFGFYTLFSQRKLTDGKVVALGLVGIILLSGVYLSSSSPAAMRSVLPDSALSLWDRRAEDTRSAQFTNFFKKVSPDTFLLGIGIPRPGQFSGIGVEGIDLGYVNILFIGGVPALTLFLLLHIVPAVRCIGSRFDSVDAACLASVMTYGVRLLSSTVPAFEPRYLLLMILVGRCIRLSTERKSHCRSHHWAHPGSLSRSTTARMPAPRDVTVPLS